MARQDSAAEQGESYTIRPYEPGDREDFLELYDRVLGEASEEWFAWKYEENPYVDHVPMIVATAEGRVVGTKPCLAFRLATGTESMVALQPADVMVHPDHRRRGLYSRTTERLKEHYAGRGPAMFFNFPNEATLSGSLKHGWRVVEQVRTFYRVHDPTAFTSGGTTGAAARAAAPALRAYLGARDLLADGADVAVTRHPDPPADLLAGLYEERVPDRFHALRDETFYEWRFRNPKWEYTAYTAHESGSAVAGIVVGTQETDQGTVATVTDVVPLEGEDRRGPLAALLARVVDDHREADTLSVRGGTFPEEVLRQFGFHADDEPLVSRVTSPTTHVAYPLTGGDPEADDHDWTVAGLDLVDPDSWALALAEEDTY